jgi:hypothetical protein
MAIDVISLYYIYLSSMVEVWSITEIERDGLNSSESHGMAIPALSNAIHLQGAPA